MGRQKLEVSAFDRFTSAYIKNLADAADITQTEIGHALNIAQSRVSRLFAGEASLTMTEFYGFADLLGLSRVSLMEDIDAAFTVRERERGCESEDLSD